MKTKFTLTFIVLTFCTLSTFAQKLPSNFEYKRETGQDTGVPFFVVIPRIEAMDYDAARGSTFEALGAMIQPERDKYGLMFFNAKEDFQLDAQKDKSVELKIDDEDFKLSDYILVTKRAVGQLKLESAAIAVDKKVFEKLIKADDVSIRVGIVRYSLDQDNIDALHYFGAEVAKDIARRTKNK